MKIINFVLMILCFFSCTREKSTREYEIMPDMAHHYAIEAQEESTLTPGKTSMRMPVKGTIARGKQPYLYTSAEEAGKNLLNPISMTDEVLITGKKYYSIHCQPCHGEFGSGDGNIITKATFPERMPKPPVLFSQKLMDYPDGRLFHIMTKGQGNMPVYGNRIDVNTRWAIVNYLRVLQKAAQDVTN